jgi:alkanesulfonate monooxygenase SsuD/methylene tetrahydromethanopterin reductase-like flavin-dependent oxidoreductase (luciferase family)
MTEPGRRVLTRVGLRIPGWIASESTSAESTSPRSTSRSPSSTSSHRDRHAQWFDRLADIATMAERSGFDSVWVPDCAGEGLGPSGALGFEPYTVLGALATRTRTATLGAMVSPINARNPAVLAKIVTGVDVLSGGRAVLGVGMGALGGAISGKDRATRQELSRQQPQPPQPTPQPPQPTPQHLRPPRQPSDDPGATQRVDTVTRLDSLAEGLRICRAMFTEAAPTFAGDYYRIEDAYNRPRPVRAGGIPILVRGGYQGEDDGERGRDEDEGLLEVVARYADAVTLVGGVETVRDSLNTLDRLCGEVGRDPAAISRIGAGRLVIAATEKEAGQRLDRAVEHEGWDLDDGAAAIAGSPTSVADQVGELLEVGIDGVVFTMADAQDLELVAMAGTTLRSLFG